MADSEGLSCPVLLSGLEKLLLPFLNESRAPASENELVADKLGVAADRCFTGVVCVPLFSQHTVDCLLLQSTSMAVKAQCLLRET